MTGYAALLGLLGLGFGVGAFALVRTVRRPAGGDTERAGRRAQRAPLRTEHRRRWLAAAGVVGLACGAVTGWVVGGLLAATATWSLPRLLGQGTAHRQEVARVEGIAGWTEMLRDTLAAAAGLEQAIVATAHTAPEAVRPQVRSLAVRLAAGQRLPDALRCLAADLADTTADLVIAALILASERQGRQLVPVLDALAATARAHVEMRQRIDAGRARVRTTLRVVVITTISFAGGLVLLNPAFLSPYGTWGGQLVLLLIGAVFAGAFAWLRRMVRIEQPDRILADPEPIVGAVDIGDGVGQELST
ncbi:type II secretion system F family protein [Streptomyces endophyticus]|uniref:Type II secretion system F family protein n=1 Tax=Streptomyces endophyticus TaxID=714166 RepID=A0ABU6F239_9ACTN|nr:type II secretion system F family protein [Streptomyces endophyticus]MEB8338048.1 type II secretion system F family protein [Streptomyces endophyticus]